MKLATLFILLAIARCAQASPSLQAEIQLRFDTAISTADRMVIAASVVTPASVSKPLKATFAPAWETSDAHEISALARFIRIKTPPPSRQIVDGGVEYRTASVGDYPAFSVTLKKVDRVLITFYVWRSLVACDEFSAIGVDSGELAPFYLRITQRIKDQKADSTPEPTPTIGPR